MIFFLSLLKKCSVGFSSFLDYLFFITKQKFENFPLFFHLRGEQFTGTQKTSAKKYGKLKHQ